MSLRSKSKKRDPAESQEANPGVRIINPSRTKRRITARSKSGSGSPRTATRFAEEAAEDDGGARLLGGGVDVRLHGVDGGARLLGGGARLLGGGARFSFK
jgi:hypothetical protein